MKANLESDPFLASELTVLKIGVLYTSSLGLTIVLPKFLNHIWVPPHFKTIYRQILVLKIKKFPRSPFSMFQIVTSFMNPTVKCFHCYWLILTWSSSLPGTASPLNLMSIVRCCSLRSEVNQTAGSSENLKYWLIKKIDEIRSFLAIFHYTYMYKYQDQDQN